MLLEEVSPVVHSTADNIVERDRVAVEQLYFEMRSIEVFNAEILSAGVPTWQRAASATEDQPDRDNCQPHDEEPEITLLVGLPERHVSNLTPTSTTWLMGSRALAVGGRIGTMPCRRRSSAVIFR